MAEAQDALNIQSDPKWYRIEAVWTDDYFDLKPDGSLIRSLLDNPTMADQLINK